MVGSKSGRIHYRDYQVLRIDAVNQEQVEHLKHIQEKIKGIEFWTPPLNNSTADLMVSPESMDDVEEYLKVKKIDYEVLIRDLQYYNMCHNIPAHSIYFEIVMNTIQTLPHVLPLSIYLIQNLRSSSFEGDGT
ncbi:hypothetical protein RUM44_008977 [Polyplax serrata]|uniref:Carboxypeptidase activation peptide domain-containing protein n=1 Tax=Polyplax serrata TaxID=468196 RepID=A0ABR1ARC8_POLSC